MPASWGPWFILNAALKDVPRGMSTRSGAGGRRGVAVAPPPPPSPGEHDVLRRRRTQLQSGLHRHRGHGPPHGPQPDRGWLRPCRSQSHSGPGQGPRGWRRPVAGVCGRRRDRCRFRGVLRGVSGVRAAGVQISGGGSGRLVLLYGPHCMRSPLAGAVGPAAWRSRASRMAAARSTGQWPRPISTSVPTMLRT